MKLNNDYNAEVGLRIRETRESLHLTREQFSELCDISDSFLADVERGKKSITIKTLNKICTATDTSADYIVFGHHANHQSDTIIQILCTLPPEKLNSAVLILKEFAKAVNHKIT